MSGEPSNLYGLFSDPAVMAERLISSLTTLLAIFRAEGNYFSDRQKEQKLDKALERFQENLAHDRAAFASVGGSSCVTRESLSQFFNEIFQTVGDEFKGGWAEHSQKYRIVEAFLSAIGSPGFQGWHASFNLDSFRQKYVQLLMLLLKVTSQDGFSRFLFLMSQLFWLPLFMPALVRVDDPKLDAWMVEHGGLLNSFNSKRQTPLSLAIEWQKFDLARALIRQGADPMQKAQKPYFSSIWEPLGVDVLPLSIALKVREAFCSQRRAFDDRFLDLLIMNGSRVRESLSDFESEWRYSVEGAEPVPLGLVDDPIIWPSLFATERWAHASSWVTSLVRRSVTTTSIYASPALPLRAIHHEQAAQEAQTRITTGELTGVPRELVSFLFDPRLVRNQGANCTSEIAGQVASFLKGPGDLEPYLG